MEDVTLKLGGPESLAVKTFDSPKKHKKIIGACSAALSTVNVNSEYMHLAPYTARSFALA